MFDFNDEINDKISVDPSECPLVKKSNPLFITRLIKLILR